MAFNDLIRKAKMFFTSVKLVQQYKISVFETKDAEDAERFQDYGFTSQPSEGEGLVIDAGGVVMVLRIDRLKDRPAIADDDVAVWHKSGSKMHLKDGKVIDVDCATFNIKASDGVHFQTPLITTSGGISAAQDVSAAGVSLTGHTHQEHDNGGQTGAAN